MMEKPDELQGALPSYLGMEHVLILLGLTLMIAGYSRPLRAPFQRRSCSQ